MSIVTKTLVQTLLIVAVTNLLIFLTEGGILGKDGWFYPCIMILALGLFTAGIFLEIVYNSCR